MLKKFVEKFLILLYRAKFPKIKKFVAKFPEFKKFPENWHLYNTYMMNIKKDKTGNILRTRIVVPFHFPDQSCCMLLEWSLWAFMKIKLGMKGSSGTRIFLFLWGGIEREKMWFRGSKNPKICRKWLIFAIFVWGANGAGAVASIGGDWENAHAPLMLSLMKGYIILSIFLANQSTSQLSYIKGIFSDFISRALSKNWSKFQGGRTRTRLPKFKFSANFPIGLHVILQLQIKKIQKCLISYVKKYFNRKSVELQRWTPLEVIQNEFCLWITVRCMQRLRKSVLPHWIRLYRPPLQNLIFKNQFCSSLKNHISAKDF